MPTPDENTVQTLKESILTGNPLPEELRYYHLRKDFSASYARMREGLPVKIAFVGGSITAMKGWREETIGFLERSFLQNHRMTMIEAGIPSFDSVGHAFRLHQDVFSHGKIDLLIYEAAVNDECNGRSEMEIRRSLEGVLRQARENNPRMDILLLYFADDMKIEEFRRTGTSHIIALHEELAAAYGVTSIDLSRHVIDSIRRGDYDWDTFGGLHPAPFGHAIYARSIANFLTAYWRAAEKVTFPPQKEPSVQREDSFLRGNKFDVPEAIRRGALILKGFHPVERWHRDDVDARPDFADVPMLEGSTPGDRLIFTFIGTAVGIFAASGPRAGDFRYRIDGGAWQETTLYTRWSHVLHLPWAVLLAQSLPDGRHQLELEILPSERGRTDCVIRYFLVNGSL